MLVYLLGNAMAQSSFSLLSPDKRIEIRVRAADKIQYDVLFKGTPLLQTSTLSIDIDHQVLGTQPKVTAHKENTHDGWLEPVVRQKSAKIRDNYNELRLEMDGNYAVVFRAYNEGAAYRLETSLPQSEVKVYGEESNFNFPDNFTVFYPQEESFMSHNERKYTAGENGRAIAPMPSRACQPSWT